MEVQWYTYTHTTTTTEPSVTYAFEELVINSEEIWNFYLRSQKYITLLLDVSQCSAYPKIICFNLQHE